MNEQDFMGYDQSPAWGVTVLAEDDEATEELDEAWSIRETEELWTEGPQAGVLTSEANLHRLVNHILDPEHGGTIRFILSCGAEIEFDIDPR